MMFTQRQKESIIDALEMRISDCKQQIETLKSVDSVVATRLHDTFKAISDSALATLIHFEKLDEQGDL